MNTEPRTDALAQRALETHLGMSSETAYETLAQLTAAEQAQLAEVTGDNAAEQAGHILKAAAERLALATSDQ